MIFGFNTDIKHSDTVYHVQSEAREGELLLQTQVFVRGRCIGKRATSYADKASTPGFTDQQKEQILRDQHRLVLDAVRDGRLDSVFDKKDTPESLAAIKELDVQWVNADSPHSKRNLLMKLRVTESGSVTRSFISRLRLECGESALTHCTSSSLIAAKLSGVSFLSNTLSSLPSRTASSTRRCWSRRICSFC